MNKLALFSLTFFFMQTLTANAAIDPERVECSAWTHDQSERNKIARAVLKKSVQDSQYFEAEIANYEFGADYSFLNRDGIGLIVFDKKTKRFSEGTFGFRRSTSGRGFEADFKFYDRLPDNRVVVAGIQCIY